MIIGGEKKYSHTMSTIKKIGALVILTLLSLSPAVAETASAEPASGRYGFSFSPLIGILYGHAEEIVYRSRGRPEYISELRWDLKPLIYTGLAADYGPRDPFQGHGFSAAFSAKFGLPLQTGYQENRDWLYPDSNGLTNYSRHDAHSQNTLLADFSLGYSWRLSSFLSLRAYGELSFMHFNWLSYDGYLQYLESNQAGIIPGQVWNSNIPKVYSYGPAVQYVQNWFILSPGLSLKARFTELFSAEANFRYSPLVFCKNRDEHFYRSVTFSDEMFFGHFYDGGGRFIVSPSVNLELSLSAAFRYIYGMRGDITVKNNGVAGYDFFAGREYLASNDAGAGYSALDIGLTVKLLIPSR